MNISQKWGIKMNKKQLKHLYCFFLRNSNNTTIKGIKKQFNNYKKGLI